MVLGIYGTGGFASDIFMLVRQINDMHQRWDEIVFIEDMKEISELEGKKVFRLDAFAETFDNKEMVIAVGEPSVREEVYGLARKHGIKLCTLVHPEVYIDKTVSLGEGSIVMAGVYLGSHADIGINTVLQANTVIGHHTSIGMHCTICPGCCITGTNKVGDRTFFGFLSGTKQNLTIGSDVVCSAGAVVFQDLPDEVIVIGNPARIVMKNKKKRVFR